MEPTLTTAATEQATDMVMQSGFAGFSIFLLAILFWLIRELIYLQRNTASIMAEFQQTNKQILEGLTEQTRIINILHDKIISRPCIAKREQTD